MKRLYSIFFILLVLFNTLSCQRHKAKTDSDTIDDSMNYLNEGQAQKAIDTLTPVTSNNKSPQVMSILAAAYLYRAHISTQEIINLFLKFNVESKQNSNNKNDKLSDFSAVVFALNDFLLKLAAVPEIKNKEQENDVNTALYYLKLANPSTPGIALQRGLTRLIIAKYLFNRILENSLISSQDNKCDFILGYFYSNLSELLDTLEDILLDLKEANPKKSNIWDTSLNSINNTRDRIENLINNELPTKQVEKEMFIYFLKSNSVDVRCTP